MQYSPIKFKEKMEKYSFNLKKMFGQNFIIDENIINNIINSANIDKDTLVIEIGPGAGSLTFKLSQYAKNVLCYEIDTTLKELLEDNLSECSNINIIFKDFLKANVLDDIKQYDYKKLYVVANLPYYITTPIIVKFIEENIPVDKIVVMVQKEVGDRFKAKPNTKEYNSLSIYLNYYFEVKKLLDISKNVFIPKPNVDSIVVEFTKKENKFKLKDEKIFFNLVKDSFTQKRKTIKNNLKKYNLEKIEEVLKKYNFDLTVRAEQLPIEVFVDIANNL
ncbi:MAG: 16S rRNA (adenine(1518)-N(6)/adenine(1519)-N(6))-dimethyltransferase RsmA [Bacilli bacterium]|nr:16S rRNA (adenine(1518)-N(6)/adenine(1519)-N(6))-dimethyltransferase RsmA [Bacilli bacterium]